MVAGILLIPGRVEVEATVDGDAVAAGDAAPQVVHEAEPVQLTALPPFMTNLGAIQEVQEDDAQSVSTAHSSLLSSKRTSVVDELPSTRLVSLTETRQTQLWAAPFMAQVVNRAFVVITYFSMLNMLAVNFYVVRVYA